MLSITDVLLFTLIGLSLVGLWHPVKTSEGWMDAVRWGTLWMVYHQAQKIPRGLEKDRMLSWIEGIGVFLATLAWFVKLSPWIQGQGFFLMGSERLSSLFGYPNALGVYLAAVLLLRPRSRIIEALLFFTLVNTGSRAAIFLFLIVWGTRGVLRWKVRGILSSPRENVYLGISIITALLLTLGLNPGALQHLLDWGIQNSLGERFLYIRDGLKLAWTHQGIPQAGGWLAFPVVQNIPYWTTDPHSLWIRVLLNQGIYGVLALLLWSILVVKQMARGREWVDEDKCLEIYSALLFLGLHAIIDADFLFGTLGILFWILIGLSFSQQAQVINVRFEFKSLRTKFSKRTLRFRAVLQKKYFYNLKYAFEGLLFMFLGFALFGAWVYPELLDSSKVLHQEMAKTEGNKQQSLEVLKKSLSEDQTQLKVRREIASLELELKGASGLEAAEQVLAWEKFDVRTYEWIQGCVLEEAEKRRITDPSNAFRLYQWCEKLPARLEDVASISTFEGRLWPGAINFQPSELMRLLAVTAKERQLTLL
jgi:hypothetical protein